MHDWGAVASGAFGRKFRRAEEIARISGRRQQGRSNAVSAKRAGCGCFEHKAVEPMNPAQKALWYIESHLAEPLTLDEIAEVAGVSRFHLVRAFTAVTGMPVMRYARARRLTEAARALAGGAPDILNVALEADYGSHEAFTRAFRDHFGMTPEAVRAATRFDSPKLQEPITMDQTALDNLQPPRFVTGKPLLVAGIGERYDCDSSAAVPGQWRRFNQTMHAIPGRIGKVAYGVCCNGDDSGNFDYVAGVEVADFSDLPREFQRVRIPEQRYAVFTHSEHISTIRRTVGTIWNHWLPASGMKAADAPNFERYDETFDSVTGNGGLEIWVPVRE
jgi:AraC family transcriptional regulator